MSVQQKMAELTANSSYSGVMLVMSLQQKMGTLDSSYKQEKKIAEI